MWASKNLYNIGSLIQQAVGQKLSKLTSPRAGSV